MASTGVNRGGLAAIYVADVKVAYSTSATLNIELGVRDITTKDSSTWIDQAEGLASWSMDCDNLFAEDAAEGFSDLFSDLSGRTSVTVMYSSEVTGDLDYSGTAYVTSLSRSSGLDSDSETYTASFTGTGSLTEAAVV